MKNIAFLTSKECKDLTLDDRLLLPELNERGIQVTPAIWNDGAVEWTEFDAVVIRSTWDYHRNDVAFRAFIERLKVKGIPIWNPPEVVKWNIDKRYITDLEKNGVRVLPTQWRAFDTPAGTYKTLQELQWPKVVIKPSISASSYLTNLIDMEDKKADILKLLKVYSVGQVLMLQPFAEAVVEEGEWSLVYINQSFSHCVLKIPNQGDFRSQEEYGASIFLKEPPADLKKEANRIIDGIDSDILYARVDMIRHQGEPTVMELELIEPGLYFAGVPAGVKKFADGLQQRLSI